MSDPHPEVSLAPYTISDEGAELADQHEKALSWLLRSMARRRPATIVEDTVRSAHRYAMVAAEVIYLPEQIKNLKAVKADTIRYEALMRRGPFMLEFHHPSNVYPRFSPMGLEELVVVEKYHPRTVVDMYGEAAKELKKAITSDDRWSDIKEVKLWRYWSWDAVVVWVDNGGDVIEIARDPWVYPFIPWACRIGVHPVGVPDWWDFARGQAGAPGQAATGDPS